MSWSLVQQSSGQTTTGVGTFPSATTAGNLLVAVVQSGTGTAFTESSGFWTQVASGVAGATDETTIWAYFNNAGGVTSVTFTGPAGNKFVVVAEFSCNSPSLVTSTSDTGSNTGGNSASLTVTSGGTSQSGDLVIFGAVEHLTTASSITWTDPSGFSEFSSLLNQNSTNHGYAAYETNGPGGAVSATITSSVSSTSSTGWSGAMATFSQPAGSSLGSTPVELFIQQRPPGMAAPAGFILPPIPGFRKYTTDASGVTIYNTMENGTANTAVTAGAGTLPDGSAGFDNAIAGTGATLSYDPSNSAHGLQSIQVATGATSAQSLVLWGQSVGTTSRQWFRLYAYFTAFPGTSFRLYNATPAITSGLCAGLNVLTSGLLRWVDFNTATILTGAVAIPTNQWFRIEGFVIGDPAAGQVEYRLYLNKDSTVADEIQTSAATRNTNTTVGGHRFAICNATANIGPFWVDDLGASNQGYLGPVGPVITDSDTGSGADGGESITVFLTGADTGSGADGGESIAATQSDTETGTGADGGESIAATLSDSTETGTGTEGPGSILILGGLSVITGVGQAPGLNRPGGFLFPPALSWQELVGAPGFGAPFPVSDSDSGGLALEAGLPGVLCVTNGAQAGTVGTSVSHANSGDAFDVAVDAVQVGTGNTFNFDNTHAMHGSQSFKAATGASSATVYAAYSTAILPASGDSQLWVRAYVYLTGAPPGNFRLFSFLNGTTFCGGLQITQSTSGTGNPGLQWINTSSVVINTGSVTLPFNAWFRVEANLLASASGAAGQVEYKLYLTPDSQGTPDELLTSSSTQSTSTAVTQIRYGVLSALALTGPIWIDDIGASVNGYLGPSGRSDSDTFTGADGGEVVAVTLSDTDAITGTDAGEQINIPAAQQVQSPAAFSRSPGLASPAGFLLPPMPSWQQQVSSFAVVGVSDSDFIASSDVAAPVSPGSSDTGSGDDEVSVLAPSIFDADVAGGNDQGMVINLALQPISLPVTSFSPGLDSPQGWLQPPMPSWQQQVGAYAYFAADADTVTAADNSAVLYTFVNGAEAGTSGVGVTPGNSGYPSDNAFDGVTTGSGAALAYDTAHVMHGAQSFKVSSGSTAAVAYAAWSSSLLPVAVGKAWFRVYAYITGTPGATFHLAEFLNGSSLCASLVVTTTQKLGWVDAGGNPILTGSVNYPLATWFRIEGYCSANASTGQVEYKLFLTADSTVADETQTSAATQNTGSQVTTVHLGLGTAVANIGPFWMDDLGASGVGYIGPAVSQVSDSDAFTGTETQVTTPTGADSSAATVDAGESITAAISDSDAFTGGETAAAIIIPVILPFAPAPGLSHPGAFSFPPPVPWQQIVGVAASGLVLTFADVDFGFLVDGSGTAHKVDADTGSGSDAGPVTIGTPTAAPATGAELPNIIESDPATIKVSSSDTGSGAESDIGTGTIINPADIDAFTGTESDPSTIALTSPETGSGLDAGETVIAQQGPSPFVIRAPGLVAPHGFALPAPTWQQMVGDWTRFGVNDVDTVSGIDAGEKIAPPSDNDAGSGFDTGNWSVVDKDTGHLEDLGTSFIVAAEAGTGAEASVIDVMDADSCHATEIELSSHPVDSDVFTGSELWTISGPFTASDTGSGTETSAQVTVRDFDLFVETDEDPGLIDIWPVQITWTGSGWFRVVWHPGTHEEVEIFRTKTPTRAHFRLHDEINRFGLTLLGDSDSFTGDDENKATANISSAILESAALSAEVPGEPGVPGQFGWAQGFPAQQTSPDEDGGVT